MGQRGGNIIACFFSLFVGFTAQYAAAGNNHYISGATIASLGKSFHSDNWKLNADCITFTPHPSKQNLKNLPIAKQGVVLKRVETLSEIEKALNFSADAMFQNSFLNIEADFARSKVSKSDSQSVHFTLDARVLLAPVRVENVKLQKSVLDGMAALSDVGRQIKYFANSCGQEYISSIQYGFRTKIVMRAEVSTNQTVEDLEAHLNAAFDSGFSEGSASVSFKTKMKNLQKNYNLTYIMESTGAGLSGLKVNQFNLPDVIDKMHKLVTKKTAFDLATPVTFSTSLYTAKIGAPILEAQRYNETLAALKSRYLRAADVVTEIKTYIGELRLRKNSSELTVIGLRAIAAMNGKQKLKNVIAGASSTDATLNTLLSILKNAEAAQKLLKSRFNTCRDFFIPEIYKHECTTIAIDEIAIPKLPFDLSCEFEKAYLEKTYSTTHYRVSLQMRNIDNQCVVNQCQFFVPEMKLETWKNSRDYICPLMQPNVSVLTELTAITDYELDGTPSARDPGKSTPLGPSLWQFQLGAPSDISGPTHPTRHKESFERDYRIELDVQGKTKETRKDMGWNVHLGYCKLNHVTTKCILRPVSNGSPMVTMKVFGFNR